MLFRDAISKQNFMHYYVKTENIAMYVNGITELQ